MVGHDPTRPALSAISAASVVSLARREGMNGEREHLGASQLLTVFLIFLRQRLGFSATLANPSPSLLARKLQFILALSGIRVNQRRPLTRR